MKEHVSRDRVLEALYQADLREPADPAEGLQGRNRSYVEGAWRDVEDLDSRIEAVSEHWSVSRMAVVDRAILRLALYELLNERTPAAVVLDEAVELGQAVFDREEWRFRQRGVGRPGRRGEERRDPSRTRLEKGGSSGGQVSVFVPSGPPPGRSVGGA